MNEKERREQAVAAQRAALDAILKEREYQRKRWRPEHDRQHTPEEWSLILSTWMGKLASETPTFQGSRVYVDGVEVFKNKARFLDRLAQIGAIAVAAYENISSLPE